jgi:predicted nucleotide-binding protein (sugar kinase/HSP70/actin superfamily)
MRNLMIVLLLLAYQPAWAITEKEVRDAVRQAGGPQKLLVAMAKNMSSQAPLTLDTETTLLSAVAFDLDMNIDHQLININKKSDWAVFIKEQVKIESYQRNKLCSGDVWKVLLNQYGARGNYRYYARNGELLFSFTVEKKHCQKR